MVQAVVMQAKGQKQSQFRFKRQVGRCGKKGVDLKKQSMCDSANKKVVEKWIKVTKKRRARDWI